MGDVCLLSSDLYTNNYSAKVRESFLSAMPQTIVCVCGMSVCCVCVSQEQLSLPYSYLA